MTNNSGARWFLSGRLGPLISAVVVTALVVFVACFLVWHHLGGGAWRSAVEVNHAVLVAPQRLDLNVSSCNGAPDVSLRETDVEVQVHVLSFSTPMRGGAECQDIVGVSLREPLGRRAVVDQHTGQVVKVTTQ